MKLRRVYVARRMQSGCQATLSTETSTSSGWITITSTSNELHNAEEYRGLCYRLRNLGNPERMDCRGLWQSIRGNGVAVVALLDTLHTILRLELQVYEISSHELPIITNIEPFQPCSN